MSDKIFPNILIKYYYRKFINVNFMGTNFFHLVLFFISSRRQFWSDTGGKC